MQHFKRRAIAYIVGSQLSGKAANSIYDYFHESQFSFSGAISANVDVYDYSRSCRLTGTKTRIYDYGTSQYISLQQNGNDFSGYDYETQSNFRGTINNNSISFYDYEDELYYNFGIRG